MKTFVRTSLACAVVGLAATALPAPAPAAGGLAYDAVVRMMPGAGTPGMSGGPSSPPAPGTFQSDFAAASVPPQGPKLPFGMSGAAAKMVAGMAIMKNGSPEKHYLGTTKSRVDFILLKTADITDCVARTMTHLDLDKKTYTVTSLDQVATSHGHSAGRNDDAGSDDGTKYAISAVNKALGPMTIEGYATNGYQTTITMTATKPSGESSTNTMQLIAYYSALSDPTRACPAPPSPQSAGPGPGAACAAQMGMVMAALFGGGDSRFKMSSSGPALPSGKIAMWQDFTMTKAADQNGPGGTMDIVTERGNVHVPLADSDPIFAPPADFTKTN